MDGVHDFYQSMNVVKAPVTQSDAPDGLLHRAILEVALPNCLVKGQALFMKYLASNLMKHLSISVY